MKDLVRQAPVHYQASRGIHGAALADRDRILLLAEDVGRHNAVDKLKGEALRRGLATTDRILLSTGRVSSEMLLKAARMGVPWWRSRTSPTEMAVGLAEQLGVTVVGYLRPDSLNLYAGEAPRPPTALLTMTDHRAAAREWQERSPPRRASRPRSASGPWCSRAGAAGAGLGASPALVAARVPRALGARRAARLAEVDPELPARSGRGAGGAGDGAARRRSAGRRAESLQRFAAAWDGGGGAARPHARRGQDGAPRCGERLGLGATFVSFLPLAALAARRSRPTSRPPASCRRASWTRGRLPVVRRHARRTATSSRTDAAPSLLPSLRRRLDRAAAPLPVLRELGIARPGPARWAKERTRATSSRPAGPATAISRAWIGASAGTPARRWWRTGARRTSTSTRPGEGTGAARPRSPTSPPHREGGAERGDRVINAVLYDIALTAYIVAMAARARPPPRPAREGCGALALLLTQAGWLFHTLGHRRARASSSGRLPLLTLSELISVVIWGAVLLELWAERVVSRQGAGRLRAPGDRGAGTGVAHRAPRAGAGARDPERLDLDPRRARAGGAGRARAQLRRRAHVSPAGAPAQGEASGDVLLPAALAGDAGPAHAAARSPSASRSSPSGSCWARSRAGGGLGSAARLRPARALLAGHVAGLRGHARSAGWWDAGMGAAPPTSPSPASACCWLTLGAGALLHGRHGS